ncbi:MAG TPA: TetR/AcrR family transcriptional regulator [Candidatus Limnocylindrales bacterium]|nr:TetR/AcrR family transcriptional regulator [Candidatus Limnocylindrales bacterium]
MAGVVEEKKLSRKERELQFRLNLVLDAAEEIFADTSFAGASVEDIAQRAEISVGTLYNLFRSKEDLYRAMVSRAQNMFFDRMVERLDEARGPRDKIVASVSYYFEHFHRYARHFRLYMSATNGFQWELRNKLVGEALERQNQFVRRITDVCQEGLDKGIFKRGVSAELLAAVILGVPHPFLNAWLERENIDLMSLLPHALTIVDRILGTDEH